MSRSAAPRRPRTVGSATTRGRASPARRSSTGGPGNAPPVTTDWPAPMFWLVRAGFVARGITYGLIGAMVVAVALHTGNPGANPDQQGALALIAQAPLGRVALVVVALGLAAYALWKLALVVLGTGPEGRRGRSIVDRISNLGGGVAYAGFCVVAVRVLVGTHGTEPTDQRDLAANVLNWPAGHLLIISAGVALIAISVYQAYTALRGRFVRDNKFGEMEREPRALFLVAGRVGLTARAIVFALVGYFLVRAAIEAQPSQAAGLDTALAQVHRAPFGTVLLLIVAGGLLVFALFSLLEARYQRL